MKRGEVWWADLPAPIGRRPVLLLSRDKAYAVRSAVTVAFLTTRVRHIPAEVPLSTGDGVPRDCVVNLDLVNTIEKAMLVKYICTLSGAKLTEVANALRFALDL